MKLYPHHQHHGPTFLVPLLMGWSFFSWICDLSFNDGLVAMGIHGRQISKRNLLTIWLGWRYVRIAAVLFRYQHVPTVYVMRLDIICATQHDPTQFLGLTVGWHAEILERSPDLNKSIPAVELQWRDPKQILRRIIFRLFFVGGWWNNEILHPNRISLKGLKWILNDSHLDIQKNTQHSSITGDLLFFNQDNFHGGHERRSGQAKTGHRLLGSEGGQRVSKIQLSRQRN